MSSRVFRGSTAALLSAIVVLGLSVSAQAAQPTPLTLSLSASASGPVYPPRTPTCTQAGAITSYTSYSNVLTISGVAAHHPNQTIDVSTKRGIDGVSGSTESSAGGYFLFRFPIPAEISNYPGHRDNKLYVYPANRPRERVKVYFIVSAFLCMTAVESGGFLTVSYDGGGWGGASLLLDSSVVSKTTAMSTTTTISIPCPGVGTHTASARANRRDVSVSFSISACD